MEQAEVGGGRRRQAEETTRLFVLGSWSAQAGTSPSPAVS